MSSYLSTLWVWNQTDPSSWCGRRTAAGVGGHKASSSWQPMTTSSSPRWRRSEDGEDGPPGRLSPGPTAHPPQGRVPLKQMWYIMLGFKPNQSRRLQGSTATYCLSSWPRQPLRHLHGDSGHGCCDDTVELKALCPRSEFHWESHRQHWGHQSSTRCPVKWRVWSFPSVNSIIVTTVQSLFKLIKGLWLWIGLYMFIYFSSIP